MKIKLSYHKLIKVPRYEDNSLIEIADKCTVRDLISSLELPGRITRSIIVRVNNEPAWNSTILKDGDFVKLLVTFGGG